VLLGIMAPPAAMKVIDPARTPPATFRLRMRAQGQRPRIKAYTAANNPTKPTNNPIPPRNPKMVATVFTPALPPL